MTKIKMVATDIDGTILKHNGEFNPAVLDCLRKLDKSGVKVVLVTGRMNRSAKKIAEIIGINSPVVSFQGALVCENIPQEKILYERDIPNETAKKILAWGKSEHVHMNLYMHDSLFVEAENEFTKKYVDYQKIPFTVKPFDELNIDNVNKILLIDYNDAEKIDRLTNYLKKEYPELFICKSTDFFCEICHREATKGDGLRYLQNMYGISKEETLTIGDHNNDIELLQSGGVKVAMGNATDELKAIADYVTDTVDNDGFVKAIEKFVK